MSVDRLDLLGFVPFRLNRLATEFSGALAAEYERFGLDVPDWRVLATLGMHAEPRSASYVVRCTRTHKSRVSRAVSQLVGLGYVERIDDGGGRREIMLRLTEEGRRAYRELVPVVRDVEARLLSCLGGEQMAALDAILSTLERSLALMCRETETAG